MKSLCTVSRKIHLFQYFWNHSVYIRTWFWFILETRVAHLPTILMSHRVLQHDRQIAINKVRNILNILSIITSFIRTSLQGADMAWSLEIEPIYRELDTCCFSYSDSGVLHKIIREQLSCMEEVKRTMDLGHKDYPGILMMEPKTSLLVHFFA